MASRTMHEDADGNAGALRLLPWTHEGKACRLSPASEGGVLSSTADAVETEQVRDGREVLAHARRLLDRPYKLGLHELRFIASRLSEGLSDESRGIRPGAADPAPDDDTQELSDEEPKASE